MTDNPRLGAENMCRDQKVILSGSWAINPAYCERITAGYRGGSKGEFVNPFVSLLKKIEGTAERSSQHPGKDRKA